ncbi:paraneoplastic antigen Ma1 homolog [Aquarana catesbeiana]|uniref:paraneoplastic antigen Ma1 homolog n=1 Tax=Aquarana catesbeiana TaxID=8400 RepID=UPI003CC932EF
MGEEEYEVWIEQAMQALEEWNLSEAQKKQCISESLQGAVAEAIRNLRFTNTTCTVYNYLAMLQEEFWWTEKAADLIYQFEHALQHQGERLSEYIRWLNKILYQIVLKKGMMTSAIDQARIQQILKGVLRSALQLKTSVSVISLKYPELIKVVREEEAMFDDKRVAVRPASLPLAEVGSVGAVEHNSEIATLKSQMAQVMEMMTLLAAKITKTTNESVTETSVPPTPSTASGKRPRNNKVCFNCGEVGHYRRVCPSPVKPEVQRQKPAGNFRGPL